MPYSLVQGSKLQRPVESSAQWKTGHFYTRYNDVIDSYLEDGKVVEEKGFLKTTVDMSFDTPSRVAELISGQSTNGWSFFDGLQELRTMD